MKEKFAQTPLKEIVKKPQFTDLYGLRGYVISVLDEIEARNKLGTQGIFDNNCRKKFLHIGRYEGKFVKKLYIKQSNENEIMVGIGFQDRRTKRTYLTEQYHLVDNKTELGDGSSLFLAYFNNCEDQKEPIFLDSTKTKAGIRIIRGWLMRAIEFNNI